MKNFSLLNVLNFVTSALSAVVIVVPFALALAHIFISPLVLFALVVITIISWVLSSCACDVWVKNGCRENN